MSPIRMISLMVFPAVAILAINLIAGCVQTPAKQATPEVPRTRVVDTACSWVRPITAASADTLETKQQILAHDLALQKNCPNGAQ